jgi:Ca-activated chloride channel homolog
VFTDALPNVGATDSQSFQSMVTAASALNIGFTFFGFGSGFDAAFVDTIAQLRGGNYRFVNPEDVKTIFEEELDFLVSPIAYDLKVTAKPALGVPLAAVYGVPQASENVQGDLFEVSTVFLSKRKGGIVLRLDGAAIGGWMESASIDLGSVDLSYETLTGETEMATVPMSLPFAMPPLAGEPMYPNPQIQRTLAVTDQYLVMKRLCADFHAGTIDLADAKARLELAIGKLSAAEAALNDPNLEREVTLLQKLGQNMGAL